MTNAANLTLDVKDLHAGYSSLRVLQGISLTVEEGEIVGVLGANGAGKTTLLRAISGIIKPTSGTVTFLGTEVQGQLDYRLARAGIGHVPSGRELFPELTVDDNLAMGAYSVGKKRAGELRQRVLDLFPALAEMPRRRAGALPGGQQQMLAVGRALMTDPKLLLLDEPSTGLAPAIVTSLFEAIRQLIKEGGMGVVLVEQNAALALEVVHRAYVIQQGRCVLSGVADELQGEGLISAYLG